MDYGGAHHEHLKANTSASNNKHPGFTPLVPIVNSDHVSGSRPDGETNLKEIGNGSAKSLDSSDTVSSSSSNSSSDNFFRVNPQILPKFRVQNNIPKPNGGTKPWYKNEKLDVSNEALYKLEESVNDSPQSTSQFSDVTYESLVPNMSPTRLPIIQVMERPGDFDPNRIPSSIFSRPSTPTEWSVASNDSLFSIHIGNNSFSRDHVSRIDVDVHKSGELPKSGELSNSGESCQSGEPLPEESCQSGEPYKPWELFQSGELYRSRELYQSREQLKAGGTKSSGELIGFSPTSPTRKGVEPDKNIGMAKTIGEDMSPGETGRIDKRIYDVPKALVNNQIDGNTEEFSDSSTTDHYSDKSESSIPSFDSPIKKKSSSPLCHCPDCCGAVFCCKWSACSFKWFTWPKCFRNCFSWKGSCCKWPSLSSCCCKCPSLSSCCCKCPSLSNCCCKCPSLSNCCCKCPSWQSCKRPSWPSCNCRCSNCTWSCCYCWSREPKRSCSDSSCIFAGGGITTSNKVCAEHQHTKSPRSKKASSRRHCPCILCSSSCSGCSCPFCC